MSKSQLFTNAIGAMDSGLGVSAGDGNTGLESSSGRRSELACSALVVADILWKLDGKCGNVEREDDIEGKSRSGSDASSGSSSSIA
jgi:hypothetical protein